MSSAEARAVNYAEQILLVHEVYAEAKEALKGLRHAQRAVIDLAAERRHLAETITDVEMVLAGETRGANPDLSQAAFERLMKEVLHKDDAMKRLRMKSLELQSKHEEAEAVVREHEFILRVKAARMEELGGLLAFYGATKASRHATDR